MKKDLSRRDFLKISGGVVGAAVITSSLFTAVSRFKTKDSPKQTADESLSKWGMVVDLRKCEGCVTINKPPQCTDACTKMHFVPKGQKWIEVYTIKTAQNGSYFLPVPCLQCQNAPCVKVCPVKATYHNKEGIVLIDHIRCIGCRLCMAACPYQRRFFNWGKPEIPPEAVFAKYSPDFPVPAKKGTVLKCMFCSHLLLAGKLPNCVTRCPMGALYMSDFNRDMASNGQEVVKLSRFLDENHAYRYKEELGTDARVWYVPGHGGEFGISPQDLNELENLVWPESGV